MKDISQCRQTINIFATLLLGNTLRALTMSYRLPWQHARYTKSPLKLQFLKIIWKTKSVTYRFYFFVGNLPKFFNFLQSMTKCYLVEFKMHREKAFYSLQKTVLDNFPRKVPISSTIVNHTCMQKIKIGHQAKFRDKDKNKSQLYNQPCSIILFQFFFRRFFFLFARRI